MNYATIIKHVWTEPKSVAQWEWLLENDGYANQLSQQVNRHAMQQFVDGDGWPEPEQRIAFHKPMMVEPDWDWWEPRHDQPWRRTSARDHAAGIV